ncbi:hypothetical protein M3Y96_00303000 [Aphelenchoides besseyi]|nr:hypothetical protein M3Y96_00303000 [Aphelenchoides besseyi]
MRSPLAFYMILFESPTKLQNFRKVLLITTVVDFVILIMNSLGELRIRYVDDIGLHSFVGVVALLPFEFQMILHVLYISTITVPFIVLPLPFWYRDRMLRHGPPTNCALLCLMSLMAIVTAISLCLFAIAISETNRAIDYGPLWYPEQQIPPLIVRDPLTTAHGFISMTYDRIAMFGSFLICVIMAYRSYHFLQGRIGEFQHLRSMKQFSRLIFAQMLIPTFGLFVPLTCTILLMQAGTVNEFAQNFLMSIEVWTPPVNAITTLVFIVPYRKAILLKLRRLISSSQPSSVQNVHPVSSTRN